MTETPNVLLLTVDDMNWDAVGAYGCPVPDTTPHVDALADAGLVVRHAHVAIAVCQPSRSVMLTGRYPHNCGGEGFFHLRRPDVPILPGILREAGYRVGIVGKYEHSTPLADFTWDHERDMPDLGLGRDPRIYGREADAFVGAAVAEGRPFFLMANAHDPHRPFHGSRQEREKWDESKRALIPPPSRVFDPAEVVTPGFLPDLPEVRREIAEYYSSVRRADDTVGAVLAALERHGVADATLVIFLSDNGMAFPFAKTNCYLHSTRTPLVVRWPGRVAPGRVETRRMVGGVDLAPTVLDACGIARPPGIDGTGLLPLLDGEPDGGRDRVFTQFHQTAGRRNYPMRCVRGPRWGYIWNPWADGVREFCNESMSGRTFPAMAAAAPTDPAVAARERFFRTRAPEELYDFARDPHALENRIDDPACADEAEALRGELAEWMAATDDPALPAFRARHDRAACEALLDRMAATYPSR